MEAETLTSRQEGKPPHYITWVATLLPEKADVAIDSHYLIPGNPWWTIHEHAMGTDIPSATAIPVNETCEEDLEHHQVPTNKPVPPPQPHCILLCSPIELIVGVLVSVLAILGVLICELLAVSFYLVAFVMYWLAKIFDPPNVITGLLYSFFMVLYYSFALADSVCLLTSVLVAETLAATCWIVSVIFGGIWKANHWHQYIRRMCHLIRWAFRAPFSEPPRNFAMCCLKHQPEDVEMPDSLVAAEVVHDPNDRAPGVYMSDSTEAVTKQ